MFAWGPCGLMGYLMRYSFTPLGARGSHTHASHEVSRGVPWDLRDVRCDFYGMWMIAFKTGNGRLGGSL